jgi:hypothetical protein
VALSEVLYDARQIGRPEICGEDMWASYVGTNHTVNTTSPRYSTPHIRHKTINLGT